MSEAELSQSHAAEAAALGFLYQSYYALLILVSQTTDNAAIGLEQLDDVELQADGRALLYQLKHSMRATPSAVTLKSRALWRTVKVWVDVLPSISLAETTFHLVTVGSISKDSPLQALTDKDADRNELVSALTEEAKRVRDERAAAELAKTKPLPHGDRIDGCEAFLNLTKAEQINLMRRCVIKPDSPTVGVIEVEITKYMTILPSDQRALVARRLIEWWDRQVVYSLCGKRERVISRGELQHQISVIVGDIDQNRLMPEFETAGIPEDYQPDGMLARQINLVKGSKTDLSKAIREEWRAREQRSSWMNGNPAMAATIYEHDLILHEFWSDRHAQIKEDCVLLDDAEKCESGLALLRWTHNDAPNLIRPIAPGWNAAYYVRGSYQVLAINLSVGWHPDFDELLGGSK